MQTSSLAEGGGTAGFCIHVFLYCFVIYQPNKSDPNKNLGTHPLCFCLQLCQHGTIVSVAPRSAPPGLPPPTRLQPRCRLFAGLLQHQSQPQVSEDGAVLPGDRTGIRQVGSKKLFGLSRGCWGGLRAVLWPEAKMASHALKMTAEFHFHAGDRTVSSPGPKDGRHTDRCPPQSHHLLPQLCLMGGAALGVCPFGGRVFKMSPLTPALTTGDVGSQMAALKRAAWGTGRKTP